MYRLNRDQNVDEATSVREGIGAMLSAAEDDVGLAGREDLQKTNCKLRGLL